MAFTFDLFVNGGFVSPQVIEFISSATVEWQMGVVPRPIPA